MMNREQLYKRFGPKLLEAIVITMLEETNRLRERLDMPPVTRADVMQTIANKLANLDDYDWMNKR